MPRPLEDTGVWRRASELYDRLVELAPAEREAALRAATEDADLREAVGRWLAAAPERVPEQCPLPPEALVAGPLEPGTMLGAWRIIRLAGEGGMGVVYEAERADGSFSISSPNGKPLMRR